MIITVAVGGDRGLQLYLTLEDGSGGTLHQDFSVWKVCIIELSSAYANLGLHAALYIAVQDCSYRSGAGTGAA